jgi:hypothetical protein
MSKQEKKAVDQLHDIVQSTYAKLLDNIIVRVDNYYVIFNRYAISKTSDYIVVIRRRDMMKFRFNSVQYAITFVILDHYNKYTEALRVKTLDSLLAGVQIEQAIHDRLKTSSQDTEKRSIYLMKSHVDRDRNKRFTAEMTKYINTAKSLFLKQE